MASLWAKSYYNQNNYDQGSKYEKIVDNESVIRNKTFVGATLNKLTLADFFILKNSLIIFYTSLKKHVINLFISYFNFLQLLFSSSNLRSVLKVNSPSTTAHFSGISSPL